MPDNADLPPVLLSLGDDLAAAMRNATRRPHNRVAAALTHRGRRGRRARRSRWSVRPLILAGVLCVVAGSAFAAVHWTNIETAVKHGAKPPAPAISLPTIGTRLVPGSWLHDDHARDVAITFWASWCAPCLRQLRVLAELNRDLTARHQGGGVLLVDVLDQPAVAVSVLTRLGINLPALNDHTGTAFRRYGAVGVPTTFIVDTHGRVVAFANGQTSLTRLTQLMTKARDS
jgi:thiol-disulfide isomerase/thioredoxin